MEKFSERVNIGHIGHIGHIGQTGSFRLIPTYTEP